MLVSIFLVFFLAFRYTPLGRLVGVKEEAADSVGIENERRIRALAEEMAILREYNVALRKALGERSETESVQSRVEEQKNAAEKQQGRSLASASAPVEFGSPSPSMAQVALSSMQTVSSEGLKASFPLLAPVTGAVTQGFEPENKHFGVDYAAKEGSPVHAAAQGYVVFAGWTYDYGNTLILSHGGGYITVYKHCLALLKSTGAPARRGELICLVGDTGQTSKGPHLHFEVLRDGVPLDPTQLLLSAKLSL